MQLALAKIKSFTDIETTLPGLLKSRQNEGFKPCQQFIARESVSLKAALRAPSTFEAILPRPLACNRSLLSVIYSNLFILGVSVRIPLCRGGNSADSALKGEVQGKTVMTQPDANQVWLRNIDNSTMILND